MCAHVCVHGGHASPRRHAATQAKPRKCAYLLRAHQEHLSLCLALEGTSSSAATSTETIAAFVRTCRGECDGMCCGDPVKQCWNEKMGTVHLTCMPGRKKKRASITGPNSPTAFFFSALLAVTSLLYTTQQARWCRV